MNLDPNRRLKITNHARERAEQFQIPIKKLVWMFWNSEEEPEPPGSKRREGWVTAFRRNGTVVMTAGLVNDKRTEEPIYLLLTIYDQRMDLPAEKI
jgi:hypothetical protein